MKANRLALAVVAAVCTLSAPAFATPVILSSSIASNTLLNNTNYTGTFNGAGVLPASYTINSLSYSFNFTDNAGDAINYGALQTLDPTVGAYGLTSTTKDRDGTVTKNWSRDVLTNKTALNTSAKESVSLALAGINVGSGATSMTSSTTTSTSPSVAKDAGSKYVAAYCSQYDGDGNCLKTEPATWNYYTDNTATKTVTTAQDWSGSFAIAGATTNQQIINQLLNGNALQFGLTVGGSVILANAQITLDITENAVPEPSTLALMLAAVGGLGYSMRRRSAQK
jgi:hypothetical protein